MTAENAMSKFGDGSVASLESGPWDLKAAQDAVGKDNLGIAVYPKISIGGNEVQQKAFLGVKLFAVNQAPAGSDTKRIAASYKLASMLTSAESQENPISLMKVVTLFLLTKKFNHQIKFNQMNWLKQLSRWLHHQATLS